MHDEVMKVGRRRQIIEILVRSCILFAASETIWGAELCVRAKDDRCCKWRSWSTRSSSASRYPSRPGQRSVRPSLIPQLRADAHRGALHTASLVPAIVFYHLFGGLSLGIRIAGLHDKHHGGGGARALKPLLAVTFAMTTSLGIGLGLATLGGARARGRAFLSSPFWLSRHYS